MSKKKLIAVKTKPYNPLEIVILPNSITTLLSRLVILLAAGHIAVYVMSFLFDIRSTPMSGLFVFLNMGDESNLPTYVSALYLLFAGCLCLLISRDEFNRKKRLNWYWLGLAVGLLLMSMDEAAMIHEGVVASFLRAYISRGSGIMYYIWYKAYIPVVLVIACLYLPFLKRLSIRYSLRFILSGIVYFTGSLGFEMLESHLVYYNSSEGLKLLGLSILVEETLEMMGIVILIHTLLLYLGESNYTLRLNFSLDQTLPTK